MSKKIMLSLIGDQAIPNVIAALHYADGLESVECLVSTDLEKKGYDPRFYRVYDALAGVLARFDICVSARPPVDPYDLVAVKQACERVIEKHSGKRLVFNVTGGTKIMALGAMLAAVESKADIPVVYVETRDRKIIHLDGQGSYSRSFDESALKEIDVERYLAAYSVTVLDSEGFKAGEKRNPFPNDKQAIVADFIAQTPAAVDLLDRFRGGNQPGKGRDYLCPITRDQLTRGERHALEFFQTHGIVRLEEAKKELCICVFSRYVDFIWGDWLECYTYNVAALLTDAAGAPFFDDCRLSVTINWEGRQQTEAYQDPKDDNEIDVVAIRGARLVACECKAGADMLQSDWIYKLEAVTRPTGLYCDRVLVTSRKRREGDRDYKSRMRRALNLGVVVVTTETLEKLGEILRDPTAELERLREEVSGW